MCRRPTTFCCCLLALSICAVAGEKFETVVLENNRRYVIPAVIVGGNRVAIKNEEKRRINYLPPYNRRNSTCFLTVGGDSIASGASRTVSHYGEFAAFKTWRFLKGSEDGGNDIADKAWQKFRVLREDQTSIIYTGRWRQNKKIVYGIRGLVLANDLPLSLSIQIFDKNDDARETELENAVADWITRVLRANRNIHRETLLPVGTNEVKLPFPYGFDRFLRERRGYAFFALSTPPPLEFTGSHTMLEVSTAEPSAGKRTDPEALALFGEAFIRKVEGGGAEVSEVARGRKNLLLRIGEPGQPDRYRNYVAVKSCYIALDLWQGGEPGLNPRRILDEWRRELYKSNGEIPE